jgi:hypothetical protein
MRARQTVGGAMRNEQVPCEIEGSATSRRLPHAMTG